MGWLETRGVFPEDNYVVARADEKVKYQKVYL